MAFGITISLKPDAETCCNICTAAWFFPWRAVCCI